MSASMRTLCVSGRRLGDAGHAFDDLLRARPQAVIELLTEEAEMPDAPDLEVGRCNTLKGARCVGVKVDQVLRAAPGHEFVVGDRQGRDRKADFAVAQASA